MEKHLTVRKIRAYLCPSFHLVFWGLLAVRVRKYFWRLSYLGHIHLAFFKTASMRLPVFLSFFAITACQNQAPESRFDKMAVAYCDCTAQLVSLNKKSETMTSDTSLSIDFQALQAEYEKAKECAATLSIRFGKLKPQEMAEMEKSLALKCPDLSTQKDLLRELLGE